MSLYEKKIKDKDPLTKGAATPANGSFNELDYTNIERKHAKRYLSWACVVYPGESLPENWKSILGDFMISWAMSPLHDQDINADGEKKRLIAICFCLFVLSNLTLKLKKLQGV